LPRRCENPYFYPITIDLEYRLWSLGVLVRTGRGRTTGLSSNRVEFESGDQLPPEMTVEIAIAWPVLLNDAVSLQLYVLGHTVRSSDHCITVVIQRYEFRTRRARPGITGPPKLRLRPSMAGLNDGI
jgi:hypothetical protein